MPTCLLVHETPAACARRLQAQGYDPETARQVASYLDQAHDILPWLDQLEHAFDAQGLGFRFVDLASFEDEVAGLSPRSTMIWLMTDGFRFYQGTYSLALAEQRGLPLFAHDSGLAFLASDKLRAGAVLKGLGAPTPATFSLPLDINAELDGGLFVKPRHLGAKIGIWADSHCHTSGDANLLAERIARTYGDEAIAQAYVPGDNIRVSFLDVTGDAGPDALGVYRLIVEDDHQTMMDSMALYGENASASPPAMADLRVETPALATEIADTIWDLKQVLGLGGVFSFDLRAGRGHTPKLIEFEVCPGLPCYDFVHYCRDQLGLDLPEAMARAAAARINQLG
ncbi:MAG: D-alanine:D-lactate ligase-like protein [Geminicoccaceae bacterium]